MTNASRLAQLAPPELAGIILDVAWDLQRLHAVDLPAVEVALAELRWQLDLPWWRHDGRHFSVTPNQVRAEPVRFDVHWRRTLAADLGYPIHLAETRPGRWTILDGVHRLLKADLLGLPCIAAVRMTPAALTSICRW